jgi:hypothetical protein
MTASDHLSGTQFMGVEELLNTHSTEALRRHRQLMLQQPPAPPGSPQNGPWEHGDHTTVRSRYAAKAADIADHSDAYHRLDEHLRSGSIDPVLLERDSNDTVAVSEGHHRIVRAHQLGVKKLPVSYDPASQRHDVDWDAEDPPDAEDHLGNAVNAYWGNRG